ncbi:SULT1C2 [Branchiostoma lanceolatum]|uniref:Sulfotransferase n=1 Tax=Branchiostoma lanceolatum TaxID=7740 RepID=A0A8K0A3N0_BRALA|nr:SULT1C2 [Branchiostoma lanceolatum]
MSQLRNFLWTHRGVFLPRGVTKETLDVLPGFQIRDDDVVVASYPKTGIYRTCFSSAVPSLLSSQQVKVLVPMRNPKDTAVSMFHFSKKLMPMMGGNADDLRWEDFVQGFSAGIVPYGDFCDHVSGWWQMRDDPHFLFLKYEDMKKDLLSAVKTIVTFLEVDLDESTVKEIAEASTFNNMKPVLDNAAAAESRHIARKGIAGDWKNTFSAEESEAFDTWCEKKLGGTGLTFDFE